MRAIDLNKVEKRITDIAYELPNSSRLREGMLTALRLLKDIPELKVESDAEWLDYTGKGGPEYKTCSRCSYTISNGVTDTYCPSCGAFMKGERKHKCFWSVDAKGNYYCNTCGQEAPWISLGSTYGQMASPYCYKCGARMNGK